MSGRCASGRGYFISLIAMLAVMGEAHAQEVRRLALKNGESLDIATAYYVVNCRSVMVGLPVVEILEGAPELTLSIREEQVLPRRQNCSRKVPGGTLVLKADGVKEKKEAKLTYRLKYKTRDGDRQTSNTFIVSLFP